MTPVGFRYCRSPAPWHASDTANWHAPQLLTSRVPLSAAAAHRILHALALLDTARALLLSCPTAAPSIFLVQVLAVRRIVLLIGNRPRTCLRSGRPSGPHRRRRRPRSLSTSCCAPLQRLGETA